MLVEIYMKFYKFSIIVGSFKGVGIFFVKRDVVFIILLKFFFIFLNFLVIFCKNNVRENLNLIEM